MCRERPKALCELSSIAGMKTSEIAGNFQHLYGFLFTGYIFNDIKNYLDRFGMEIVKTLNHSNLLSDLF